MKLFKIVTSIVTVLAVSAIGLSAASADSPGQLTGGPQVYLVKNVTQGGSYVETVSANACDTVQYSTELHNAAFGGLTHIIVTATLPGGSSTSNTSTVTATPAEGSSTGTTDTATVNISSAQSLSYVAGSAKLYNGSGGLITILPDTITGSGVNIGDMPGSTTEFVNFQAKVSCPSAPTPTPASTTPKPAVLPNTGAGDVLGVFAGASAAGTAAHMAVTARRNRR